MEPESYYIKSGEREKGPYKIDVLQSSVRDGSLPRTTLVRAEGSTEWVRLNEAIKLDVSPGERAAAAELRADHEAEARARRDRKQRDVLLGSVFCLGGLVVTIVSYSSAAEGGGRYIVAWGAILFGGIRLVRGLAG